MTKSHNYKKIAQEAHQGRCRGPSCVRDSEYFGGKYGGYCPRCRWRVKKYGTADINFKRAIRIEAGVGHVPLSDGSEALIDAEDAPIVALGNWSKHKDGYAGRQISGHYVLLHRLIMPTVEQVDHINGDRLDDRKFNLRDGSDFVNSANSKQSAATGTRRMPSGRWQARINIRGVKVHLGTFESQEAARAAYVATFVEEWGFSPRVLH